jgi:hypothetical protein
MAPSSPPISPRRPAAPIPRRSPKQNHNTSRKLVKPPSSLFDPCMPKHRRRGKANRYHHGSSRRLPLRPSSTPYNFSPGKLLRYSLNLFSPTSPSVPHRNLITVELFSLPILFTAGIHFPPVLIHNQGYPKVCPDPLNLPSTGDPFAGTSLFSSYSLFSLTRDLIASI